MYSGVPVEIPVLRPRLPSADKLTPWLRSIDASRYYSNFGPLCQELERKIADHAGAGPGGAVTLVNGTVGLQLSLAAEGVDPGDRTLCLMPSWTFIASASAAWQAGMVPYFVDVDPVTWTLDPRATVGDVVGAPGRVGAVMVVTPFGTPVDPSPWEELREQLGRPVIIDAAAGFDSARASSCLTMISLHATKSLGVGEGGVVVSTDAEAIERVRQLSVFGFSDDRVARLRGTNAKISEYVAAVGLAALDEWPQTRAELAALKDLWIDALAALPSVELAPGLAGPWQNTMFNVILPGPWAAQVKAHLASEGIDSRQWWGLGCHRHPAFQGCPRGPLPVTEDLAASVLGLPFYLGLTADQVGRVVEALGRGLKKLEG